MASCKKCRGIKLTVIAPYLGCRIAKNYLKLSTARDMSRQPLRFRNTEYLWYDASGKRLPCGSPVIVGYTEDGHDIYVGRAWHGGNLIPAKVIPSQGGAYVGLNWKEYFKDKYSVLCDGNPTWLSARDGRVPKIATPVGHSDEGEPLYYGRVQIGEALLPGKIVPSHKGIFVPDQGEEHFFEDYEVMIMQ